MPMLSCVISASPNSKKGISIEKVAQPIRPFLAIVMITEEECRRFDTGSNLGGFGLKAIMSVG